jgi:hypothetical protein
MAIPKPRFNKCDGHNLSLVLFELSNHGNFPKTFNHIQGSILFWKVHRARKWVDEDPSLFGWVEIWSCSLKQDIAWA